MSRENSQLFGRGETAYGPDNTIDSNNLKYANWLGQEKVFEDIDFSASGAVKTHRSGEKVCCRAVRNTSGVALLPKELVQLDTAGQNAIGRGVNDSQHCYPVDEFLPSAGVRDDDVFYVVVEGPAMCRAPHTGGGFNGDIVAGDMLHSVTTTAGSTQTGTTTEGGRVAKFSTVAATTVAQFNGLLAFVKNWVGTALTARTTGNTGTDILVDVRRRY